MRILESRVPKCRQPQASTINVPTAPRLREDRQNLLIRSVSSDQQEILNGILLLCGLSEFDADITYGSGAFYRGGVVPQPLLKFDIDPQTSDTVWCDNTVHIPVEQGSLGSIVYDPPFLTYVRGARSHGSIMGARFGGYWRYDELEDAYQGAIAQCALVLSDGGVLVIKCQDIVHNHTLHPTHVSVIGWADVAGFRLKDLSILTASHRMPIPATTGHAMKVQQHARIHHSYFLTFQKRVTR